MKIQVVLYFDVESCGDRSGVWFDSFVDKSISKHFEWPICPKVSEYINVGEDPIQVWYVEHHFIDNYIEVQCNACPQDAVWALAVDESGWDLSELHDDQVALLQANASAWRQREECPKS